MTRVLVLTHDVLGPRMAGPAIRAFELARQLATACDVTLASELPLEGELAAPFQVTSFQHDARRLRELAKTAEVLLLQGTMHLRHPFLLTMGKRVVADLYDPFLFENYPHMLSQPGKGAVDYLQFWDVQNQVMEAADFSICASERQRDMWLGRYCALGRLIPRLFERDASFRTLIDCVPFGTQDTPPRHERAVLKGVVPGIRPTDKVLLWGGGVWNWFDPLTVIRAVAQLGQERDDIKLYFMGVQHPNPEIPAMEMLGRAVALAEELGVRDRLVFFNFGWVPYDDRQNYLMEADVGISAHFDAIETRFSFRTRVLDYLWAGLPVLTTEGDSMSELVAARSLGTVVRYGSVEDWVAGIRYLVDNSEARRAIRANVEAIAPDFAWSKVARPLVQYCVAPYSTPRSFWSVTRSFNLGRGMPEPIRLAFKTLLTLRTGGAEVLAEKARRYVAHRLPTRKG